MTEQAHRQNGKFFRALMHVPVPWIFVLTYLVGVALEFVCFRNRASSSTFLVTDTGLILFVAGAAFAAWGWLVFRKARTTRVPGEASTTLVTWGPYRFTRNPMYLGLIIAYLGEAGILKQVGPVLLLPLIFAYLNWIVIPVEEERLRQVFEAQYDVYRTAVGRWF
jgi:protein-S-isoprenylcysteine O-methyltransferase Ste14